MTPSPGTAFDTAADPGRREQNKSANRDAILRAARSVFLELGYEAVTIRDVIRRTGLACGTFYNYFPDKETLFRTLLAQRIGAFTERLKTARNEAATIETFVGDAYRAAFAEVAEDPEFFALLFRNEPVIRALFSENVMGLMLGSLRDDLKGAVDRGLLPPMDLDALTAAMFGAGFELCRLLVSQPNRCPHATAAIATRLFLDGLKDLSQASAPEKTSE
ncbi:MAG TPA: TetR/AcrR family transcriptional regulator [Nevskiaceae bacterium]|nr:TetR/AcrR family transcriptional regulator [Nevskiaceae bacterium]